MSKFLRTLFIPTLGPANRKKLKSELGKICKKKQKNKQTKKQLIFRTSLVVLVAGTSSYQYKAPGYIPGEGTRSHVLQL